MPCNHTEGRGHDCAYVDARNAIADQAESMASQEEGLYSPQWTEERIVAWGAAFLRSSDALYSGLLDLSAKAEDTKPTELQR